MPIATRSTKYKPRKRMRKHKPRKREAQTQAIVLAKPVPAPVEMVSVIPRIDQTIENLERVRRFVTKALNQDLQRELAELEKKNLKPEERTREEIVLRQHFEIDWGTIPGVKKPFLMQPGAEKFMLWLNLRPRFTVREREMENGNLEIVSSVIVYSKKTGEEVFQGPDCSCSTMETNFRYVWADMDVKPPADVVDRMKAQRMGRNYLSKKWVKGKAIEEWIWQQRVENPNPWEKRNTVRQIGQKRALVKCIRNMGAISEIFTADPSEWDIPEESQDPRDEQDYTAGGRKIFTEEGVSPSGRYQDTRKPTGEARGPRQPSSTSVPFTATEIADTPLNHKLDEKLGQSAKVAAPTQKPKPKIILTWPADKDGCGYLSGDLAQILPTIQKEIVCQWLDSKKAHAIPADQAHVVAEIAQRNGYELVEVSGSLTPSAPVSTTDANAKPEPAANERSVSRLAPSHTPVAGFLFSAKPGKTKSKGVPYMDTKIDKTYYHCYNEDLFEFLNAGVGKDCVVIVNERKAIIGIQRIGKRFFDADGKTPQIDVNETRTSGTASLFND